MPGAELSTTSPVSRLVFLDRLRLIATGVIFAYHCARPFDDFEGWHIKNDQVTAAFTYPMAIGSQVAMPLFWILSGMGTWLALSTHGSGTFLHRRLLRLVVPVVTLGWFVLCPPQVFIEATTGQNYIAPPFDGSFADFLPRYFTGGFYGSGGWFPITGLHLWYLTFLALFTVLSLPLFRLLSGAAGRRVIGRLGAAAGHWWLLPALGLPLLVPELLVPTSMPVLGWYEGGWRLGTYWVLLLLGFLLAADGRLRAAIVQRRRLWLALAVAILVPLLLWAMTMQELVWLSPAFLLRWGLRAIDAWLCLLAIIGYGSRYLTRPGRLLAAAGGLVLPFYVVHQTVIVLIVSVTRDWPLPIALAYPMVLATSFAGCAVVCLVVRRFGPLRFLFGLPVRVVQAPSATPATA